MFFRDDWERKAHDVICVIKHGSIGGQVQQRDIERVGDILRGHSLKPKLVIPKVNGLPVVTAHDPTKVNGKVELPNVTIKAPGFIASISLPDIKLP